MELTFGKPIHYGSILHAGAHITGRSSSVAAVDVLTATEHVPTHSWSSVKVLR